MITRQSHQYPVEQRALLSLNGSLGNTESLKSWILEANTVIAVDGGLRHLRTMSITPTLAVGDFDSLTEHDNSFIKNNQIPCERHNPHKDASDFELSLSHLHGTKIRHVQIIGGLGGRIDHTLCNLQCASILAQHSWVEFYDGTSLVTLVPPQTQIQIRLEYGSTATLLALSAAVTGAVFNGVCWPLDHATISPGSSLTLSNEIISADSTLWYEQGSLALFQWKPQ